jgi:hypothetical protein
MAQDIIPRELLNGFWVSLTRGNELIKGLECDKCDVRPMGY